jgi:hypothetical protein
MAFPSSRFAPATGEILGLRIPAELTGGGPARPADVVKVAPCSGPELAAMPDGGGQPRVQAVEVDRVVPPSGNLWIAGQQIWLGPVLSGRAVRLWAGLDRVHVLLDGHQIKTLPSRLDRRDIARLTAAGALPAGPPPMPPPAGSIIELERTVTAAGNISIGAGLPLAGQRVTVQLDGPVAHILASGVLVRTVPEQARSRFAEHVREPLVGRNFPSDSWSCGGSPSAEQS